MANKPNPQNPVEKMMLDVIPVMVSILAGTIWEGTPEEISEARNNLAAVLTGLKNVSKTFDTQLIEMRKSNPEALKSIEFFRKPRESKKNSEVSLVDLFKV